jgi:hypothetical protein
MLHAGLRLSLPGEPSPLLGILYAEDFDDDSPPPPPPDPERGPEPPPPVLTQDDIDRACAEAVSRARIAWEAERMQQSVRALASVSEALAAAREKAEQEAAAIAEGTVTTMLAMLAGALPRFCREHGPAEVRALMQHLLPMLRTESRITVRAHPDLVPLLRNDLAQLETELAGTVTINEAPCAPGDVRVTWNCGSFQRDTNRILEAMRDALGELGLLDQIDFTQEGRMELAE